MITVNVSGYNFIIDAEDLPLFQKYSWQAHKNRGEVAYLQTTILFHRAILDAPKGFVIDHINNNTFDNRKENLRMVTHAENMKNKIPAWRRREIASFHLAQNHVGIWQFDR
jgi:hypothetical protein